MASSNHLGLGLFVLGFGIIGLAVFGGNIGLTVFGTTALSIGAVEVNCSNFGYCVAQVLVTNQSVASPYNVFFVTHNQQGQTVSYVYQTVATNDPSGFSRVLTQNLGTLPSGSYTLDIFATLPSGVAVSSSNNFGFTDPGTTGSIPSFNNIVTTTVAGSQTVITKSVSTYVVTTTVTNSGFGQNQPPPPANGYLIGAGAAISVLGVGIVVMGRGRPRL